MTRRLCPITFTLNGRRVSLRVHPLKRLLDVLREDCGLTGTKEGCGEGECGACTVLLDGCAVNSCLVPAAQAAGAKVVTIEGLKGRHPLQRAFAERGGAQCGICTPGMILAAVALGPRPTLDEVRVGLAGNICRCTGYEGIYRAIQKQEARSKKSAARSREQEARSQKAGDRRPQTADGSHRSTAPIPNPQSPIPARSGRRP
jgi:carbon-monoxide dehydrogenase small subunit/xanthine dehydrogenase small subunit